MLQPVMRNIQRKKAGEKDAKDVCHCAVNLSKSPATPASRCGMRNASCSAGAKQDNTLCRFSEAQSFHPMPCDCAWFALQPIAGPAGTAPERESAPVACEEPLACCSDGFVWAFSFGYAPAAPVRALPCRTRRAAIRRFPFVYATLRRNDWAFYRSNMLAIVL